MSSFSAKSNLLRFSCLIVFLCITNVWCSMHVEQIPPPHRVKQCREGCLEKYSIRDIACLQNTECSMCLDQCASNSKLNTITNTWSLRVITMIRNLSLVTADIAWPSFNANENMQCLVTWEVSGGGLMGNLLTETSSVELSLWPETKYRIQVTCRNKDSEALTRSLPLTLDTHFAVEQSITPASISYESVSASSPMSVSASVVASSTIVTPPTVVENKDVTATSASVNHNQQHGNKHHMQKEEKDMNEEELQHLDEPVQHHQQSSHHHQQQSAANHRHHPKTAAEMKYELEEEYPTLATATTTSALTTFGSSVWNAVVSRKEAVLGLSIGILSFLCILSIFSILCKRRTFRANDKENLIENECVADLNSQILHV